jgi:hypothetical protein
MILNDQRLTPLALRATSPLRDRAIAYGLPVVSTEARRAERRDLLSTISCLSWREGLSAPRFALRSRRRKSSQAIALLCVGRKNEA